MCPRSPTWISLCEGMLGGSALCLPACLQHREYTCARPNAHGKRLLSRPSSLLAKQVKTQVIFLFKINKSELKFHTHEKANDTQFHSFLVLVSK